LISSEIISSCVGLNGIYNVFRIKFFNAIFSSSKVLSFISLVLYFNSFSLSSLYSTPSLCSSAFLCSTPSLCSTISGNFDIELRLQASLSCLSSNYCLAILI